MKLYLYKNKTSGILQLPNEIGVDVNFSPGESKPCAEFFDIYKKYIVNLGECNERGVLVEKKAEEPKSASTKQAKEEPKAEVKPKGKPGRKPKAEVKTEDKAEAPSDTLSFTVEESK